MIFSGVFLKEGCQELRKISLKMTRMPVVTKLDKLVLMFQINLTKRYVDFSTAIGNTKTKDDEASHKTIVAEVTSVCDDHHN